MFTITFPAFTGLQRSLWPRRHQEEEGWLSPTTLNEKNRHFIATVGSVTIYQGRDQVRIKKFCPPKKSCQNVLSSLLIRVRSVQCLSLLSGSSRSRRLSRMLSNGGNYEALRYLKASYLFSFIRCYQEKGSRFTIL